MSPSLFIIYTNDCVSNFHSVNLLKYADDTVIYGLIDNNDENNYRQSIQDFSVWCKDNYLELNPNKTKEMVFDFRHKKANSPLTDSVCIAGVSIETVQSYKYLGTTIDSKLDWSEHSKVLTTKGNQRLYCLRKLRSF